METIHKLMNTSGKLERDLSIEEITNGFKYDGAMNKEGVTINGSNYIAKKNKNDWNLNAIASTSLPALSIIWRLVLAKQLRLRLTKRACLKIRRLILCMCLLRILLAQKEN